MITREKQLDQLGQIIFRLETNISVLTRHCDKTSLVMECLQSIAQDLEKAKKLKTEMLQEVNG